LRRALPAIKLVQVIHVEGPEAVDAARAAAPEVDALLLDSGRPGHAIKELGGTGRVHDWETSRAIGEAVRVPVYLAGGLRAENVGLAIETVRPFGVDLCSGIRVAGRLDAHLLADFMRAVALAG
jgi:phosphoribosylanthranilate isomerase